MTERVQDKTVCQPWVSYSKEGKRGPCSFPAAYCYPDDMGCAAESAAHKTICTHYLIQKRSLLKVFSAKVMPLKLEKVPLEALRV